MLMGGSREEPGVYPSGLIWDVNLLNKNRRNHLQIKCRVSGNHFKAIPQNMLMLKTTHSFSSEIQQKLQANLFHQVLSGINSSSTAGRAICYGALEREGVYRREGLHGNCSLAVCWAGVAQPL